jgi:hypothetical protein
MQRTFLKKRHITLPRKILENVQGSFEDENKQYWDGWSCEYVHGLREEHRQTGNKNAVHPEI